jgi:hypothetical protein
MTNDGKKPHTGFQIPGPGRPKGYKHDKATRQKMSRAKTKHGVFTAIATLKAGSDPFDGRTAAGKMINQATKGLIDELGPNPSRKQLILIDLVRTKLGVLDLAGKAILSSGPEEIAAKDRLLGLWRGYAESVRRDIERLDSLGSGGKVEMDYDAYIQALKASGSGSGSGSGGSGENS